MIKTVLRMVFSLVCFIVVLVPTLLNSQDLDSIKTVLPNSLSKEISIPLLAESRFTPFHAYFSTEDGKMIVYRVQETGLQFLFENESFTHRGSIISSDYRFAYALNQENELTIIDPNSLLLVHNVLPLKKEPLTLKRVNNQLWVIYSDGVTSFPTNYNQVGDNEESAKVEGLLNWEENPALSVIKVEKDESEKIWVLKSDNSLQNYKINQDANRLEADSSWVLTGAKVDKLLYGNDFMQLGFNTASNELMRITNGQVDAIATIGTGIQTILEDSSNANSVFVVTDSNQLLRVSTIDPIPPKTLLNAGSKLELFAVFNKFWVRQGQRVYQFNGEQDLNIPSENLSVNEEEMDNELAQASPVFGERVRFVHPAGEYLTFQLPLKSGWARSDLFFDLAATSTNLSAVLQGQTLVWKPSVAEVGQQQLLARVFTAQGVQDSLVITVDVRSFNEPPNFLPSRTGTIVVGEEVQISTKAIDPDGLDRMLLRYRAKDLPKGAILNPTKGEVTWTPEIDQVGSHSFQVIASDQYGASSLQTIRVQVVDLRKEN